MSTAPAKFEAVGFNVLTKYNGKIYNPPIDYDLFLEEIDSKLKNGGQVTEQDLKYWCEKVQPFLYFGMYHDDIKDVPDNVYMEHDWFKTAFTVFQQVATQRPKSCSKDTTDALNETLMMIGSMYGGYLDDYRSFELSESCKENLKNQGVLNQYNLEITTVGSLLRLVDAFVEAIKNQDDMNSEEIKKGLLAVELLLKEAKNMVGSPFLDQAIEAGIKCGGVILKTNPENEVEMSSLRNRVFELACELVPEGNICIQNMSKLSIVGQMQGVAVQALIDVIGGSNKINPLVIPKVLNGFTSLLNITEGNDETAKPKEVASLRGEVLCELGNVVESNKIGEDKKEEIGRFISTQYTLHGAQRQQNEIKQAIDSYETTEDTQTMSNQEKENIKSSKENLLTHAKVLFIATTTPELGKQSKTRVANNFYDATCKAQKTINSIMMTQFIRSVWVSLFKDQDYLKGLVSKRGFCAKAAEARLAKLQIEVFKDDVNKKIAETGLRM